MRRLLGCLLAATAAALAVGCGGDTAEENAYVEAVNRTQTELGSTFERLQPRFTPTSSPAEDRATFGLFRSAVDTALDALRRIDPPDDVATLHRRLIAQVTRFGTEIDQAREAYRSGESERLLRAQADLSTEGTAIGRDIQRVIGDINEKLRG